MKKLLYILLAVLMIGSVFGQSSDWQSDITLWYRFIANDTSKLVDSAGTGTHNTSAVANQASWRYDPGVYDGNYGLKSKVDPALTGNPYYTIGNSFDFENKTSFQVSFIYKTNFANSSYDNKIFTLDGEIVVLGLVSEFEYTLDAVTDGSKLITSYDNNITNNEWHNLSFIYNGTTCYMLFDDHTTPVAIDTSCGGAIVDIADNGYIGSNQWTFNGTLAGMGMWAGNYLSPTETQDFFVTMYNRNGSEAPASPGNQTPTPTGLAYISKNTESVYLTVNISTSAEKYVWYINGANFYNGTVAYVNSTALTSGTEYTYTVKVYNSTYTTMLSNSSNSVAVTTDSNPSSDVSSLMCDGKNYTYPGDIDYIEFCNKPSSIPSTGVSLHDFVQRYPEDESSLSNFVGQGTEKSGEMTYKGSPFMIALSGSVNLPLAQFIHNSYSIPGMRIFSNTFQTTTSADTFYGYPQSIRFERSEATKDQEGYCSFINEYTILCSLALSNPTASNIVVTYNTDIDTAMNSYHYENSTDIDGFYGMRLYVNESCTGSCNDEYRYKWLMAVNITPIWAYSARNVDWAITVPAGQTVKFTYVMTSDFYEDTISDWMADPMYYHNQSRQALDTWTDRFSYPTEYCTANSSWCEAYYRNVAGFWQDWQCPISNSSWQRETSYFDQDQCFWSPARIRYHGVWTSDTSRMCEDILRASSDQEVINMCKTQTDIFSENMNVDHYRSDIRDTYLGTGIQSPLLQCTIYQIYLKDQNKTWLADVYQEAEQDTDWRYANRRETNGLYFCGGLECGDGRGSNVVAPDVNAEMYWLYQCMESMARELNYTTDVTKWSTYGSFLDGHIDDFYKDCQGYGPIFSDLTIDTLECKQERNDSTAFAFKLLWTNHSDINSTHVAAHVAALEDMGRYRHPLKGLSDISIADDDWGVSDWWWSGERWTILSQFAVYGLNYYGEAYTASRLRNETVSLIAETSTGLESYDSNDESYSGGSYDFYGWTMGNMLSLMNSDDYIFNLSVVVATGEESNDTQENVTITFQNRSHPRLTYTINDNYKLANDSTLHPIDARFDLYKADVLTLRSTTFTNNSAYAAGIASTLAFDCFNNTVKTSCPVAKVYLDGYLNQSNTYWWNKTNAGLHYAVAEISKAYDWLYHNLTDVEKERYINKMWNIISVRLNNSDIGFDDTKMANNNGQADDLADCLMVYAIVGEYSGDTLMQTEVQKCDNLVNNYWRSYFDTSVDLEGVAYWAYMRYAVDGTVAYELYEGTEIDLPVICNVSDSVYQMYIYNKTTGRTGNALTHLEYGDSYRSANFDPRTLAWLADRCNNPVLHWIIDWQFNETTEFESFSNAQYQSSVSEFTYYNHTIGLEAPTVTEFTDGTGMFIWREGWTLQNDTVIAGWSRDQSMAHPNADNGNLVIYYKGKDMLTEGGYRNGSGENPKDVEFHNVMMVNDQSDLAWWQSGYEYPSVYMFWGADEYPLSSDCTESTYRTCQVAPAWGKGSITDYIVNTNYNSVRKVIPYYRFNTVSETDFWFKTTTHPVIVRRYFVDANTSHNLSFVQNTETALIYNESGDMLVNNSNVMMRIVSLNSTANCNWKYNISEYAKREYTGALSGQVLRESKLDCPGVTDFRNLLVYELYEAGTEPYTFNLLSNSTYEGVNFEVDGVDYQVTFSKTDYTADPVFSTFNDGDVSLVTGLASPSLNNNSIYITWTDPTYDDYDHVEVWVNTTWKANVTAGVQLYNITGLLAGTGYRVQVVPVNSFGYRAANATITRTTKYWYTFYTTPYDWMDMQSLGTYTLTTGGNITTQSGEYKRVTEATSELFTINRTGFTTRTFTWNSSNVNVTSNLYNSTPRFLRIYMYNTDDELVEDIEITENHTGTEQVMNPYSMNLLRYINETYPTRSITYNATALEYQSVQNNSVVNRTKYTYYETMLSNLLQVTFSAETKVWIQDAEKAYNVTNTSYIVVKSSLALGRVYMYFNFLDDVNHSQYFIFDNDDGTEIENSFFLLDKMDVVHWTRVVEKVGSPLEDVRIRVYDGIPNETGFGSQLIDDVLTMQDDGYSHFWLDSDRVVWITYEKDGYIPQTHAFAVSNNQWATKDTAFVVVMEPNPFDSSDGVDVYLPGSYDNSTNELIGFVYEPDAHSVKYTTSYAILHGVPNTTLSSTGWDVYYIQGSTALKNGIHFDSSLGDDITVYIYVDGEVAVRTIKYKNPQQYIEVTEPSGLDDGIKAALAFIVLIVISVGVATLVNSPTAAASIFMIGSIFLTLVSTRFVILSAITLIAFVAKRVYKGVRE